MTGFGAATAGLALAAPTYLAVSACSVSRPFGALAAHATVCTTAAAVLAAFAVAMEFLALKSIVGIPVSFALLAPPAIGAAPWAAGELCRGPSQRQEHSLAAALTAAYACAIVGEIADSSTLLRALLTALAATAAYLIARGDAGIGDV